MARLPFRRSRTPDLDGRPRRRGLIPSRLCARPETADPAATRRKFKSPQLRRALNFAFDFECMNKEIFYGRVSPVILRGQRRCSVRKPAAAVGFRRCRRLRPARGTSSASPIRRRFANSAGSYLLKIARNWLPPPGCSTAFSYGISTSFRSGPRQGPTADGIGLASQTGCLSTVLSAFPTICWWETRRATERASRS
jgi:hypothetical protein